MKFLQILTSNNPVWVISIDFCKNLIFYESLTSTEFVPNYYIDISKITKLDISKEIMKEIEEFINDYYDRYSGIYLKSKTLLDYIK